MATTGDGAHLEKIKVKVGPFKVLPVPVVSLVLGWKGHDRSCETPEYSIREFSRRRKKKGKIT